MNTAFSNFEATLSKRGRRDVETDTRDVLNIGNLFNVLWRGKLVVMLCALLGIMAGIYYVSRVATPMYTSVAVVTLNSREEQVVDLESVVGGLANNTTVINTELEVLRSRSLLGKVVNELDLTQDPEFNPFLRSPSALKERIRSIRSMLPGGEVDEAPAAVSDRMLEQIATSILLNSIEVRNLPLSLVFEVVVQTTNPQKSALIADTLVDIYIRNQLDAKFEATEQATSWLTERVSALQSELENAEAQIKAFSADTDLVSPETLAALERQLKDMRDRVSRTEETRNDLQQRLMSLRTATTPAEQAEAASDTQLTAMLPRIDTPAIAQAFETRLAQITARTELDLQRSETQLTTLQASVEEMEQQIAQQSSDLITLQQMTRETEATRLLYEYFLSRLKETSAQQGVQQADSRRLSDAILPVAASSPQKNLAVGMGLLLGFLLGSGILIMREARKDTFREAGSLEKMTGYVVMGQIPMIGRGLRRKDTISYLKNKQSSAAAEAVRNLRTSLLLSNVDNPPKVIMTTSSVPGEGKTTLAFSLAQNFTGLGKRVLLIEGDVRRRIFSNYVDEKQAKGLISTIAGESRLQDAVEWNELISADVLLAEKNVPNAADLFSSQQFRELLKHTREEYDYVIIDTPPVLVVPDPRIIAPLVDAVLFVVHWDTTRRSQVTEALHMFESADQKISGLALNKINPRGMKRYGYDSGYGAYASYGNKYYVN